MNANSLRTVAAVFLYILFFTSPAQAYTVIIDPGHGGEDAGAAPGNALEKFLTLDTCRRFAGELQQLGIPYVLTRSTDRFIPLATRRNVSFHYPDSVFVSIHFNASPNTAAKGIETFYHSSRSRALASAVQRSLISHTAAVNRGVKNRGFTVITNNTARAAILIEGGFLSNAGERRRCMDPIYRQSLARAIAQGVVQATGPGTWTYSVPIYAQTRTTAPQQAAYAPRSWQTPQAPPRYVEPRFIDPRYGNVMVVQPVPPSQYRAQRTSFGHHSSVCRSKRH